MPLALKLSCGSAGKNGDLFDGPYMPTPRDGVASFPTTTLLSGPGVV
jgi:hypothetical protein